VFRPRFDAPDAKSCKLAPTPPTILGLLRDVPRAIAAAWALAR
jgi:hypothetical protein